MRGDGHGVILYLDLACPHCGAVWAGARDLGLRLCVRHFPLASQRPRSPALHAATEAAALQGGEEAFWGMWDSLLRDQSRQDDPHLWERARELGLDLQGFQADRRSEGVLERVQGDFRAAIRAGVAGAPAAFSWAGEPIAAGEGGLVDALAAFAAA